MALAPNTMLENRYRIEQLLARGGMGAIYQGFDTNLNIPVAIKENFFETPEAVRQFQREAQILARVHHPNLPRVIHHFTYTGRQYLVMDFIGGQDLWEMVKERGRPLEESQALDYLVQVCDAVEYLHRQKPPVIHRDIKPQNIKITPDGQAVLVDFGIAKVAEGDGHTQTGAQGVTPGFSPPEQYSGEGTLPASDVYSLGATLYAVLTGQKPPNSVSRLVNQGQFKPPAELNHKLSRAVSNAVMHAMQPRIEARPQSVLAWKRELTAIQDQPTQPQETGSDTTLFGGKASPGWLVGPGGLNYRIRLGDQTLGRSSACDVHVNDNRASRKHATLKCDGQRCQVIDEGSANGTFVNDQPVGGKGIPLKIGDRLRIGDTVLTFSVTAGAPGAVPASRIDELAGTAHIAEQDLPPLPPRPASRPVSAPMTPVPAVASPPAKSGSLLWLWMGLGLLAIILLLGVVAALLYLRQSTPPPAVAPDVAAMIAAASTATAQAAARQPTSDSVQATLAALAATATAQAQNASAVDTEATVAAAIAATEAARPPTETPTATLTPVAPSPTPTPAPPTATPFPPTATVTPRPVAPPIVAAPPGVFQDFETDSAWKRGDEANGTFSRSAAQAHSGNYSGQLAYNFASAANDYVVFLQNRALSGRPNAISAWVYGDGAGHFLNLWLKDAGGQTWQMSFGPIKHTGWQEMTAVLDPGQPWPSGHISGPNNNAIDYPISFMGLVLDDGADDFRGQGTIYLDDLTSLDTGGVVVKPTVAAPTPVPTAGPVAPTPALSANYVLAVASQHRYETWGASATGDICEDYRNNNFNDKIHMKGFNLELSLTNKSSQKVADDWAPEFITAKGQNVQVCYYGYAGSGPQPGATTVMTFFTIVAPDDFVRTVRLEINGERLQICLDAAGAQTSC